MHAEQERYGTTQAWAEELGLERTALGKRLYGLDGLQGKDRLGRVWISFAESAVRSACADLLQEAPQADAEGFFSLSGPDESSERYGTIEAWSRILPFSTISIGRRLEGKRGITGRDSSGHLREHRFYPESLVRQLCADLLGKRRVKVVDESGFLNVDDERYGSATAWAKELGLHKTTVITKLRGQRSIIAHKQRGVAGNYYPESVVREIFPPLPVADEKGFIFVGEGEHQERYGTLMAWAAELGVSEQFVGRKMKGVEGIRGRARHKQENTFYPERIVRECCARLLQDVPRADASGFFFLENERYGTIDAWTKAFGLWRHTISRRLNGETGITGKAVGGQLYENGFYAESVIRRVCADLLSSSDHGK